MRRKQLQQLAKPELIEIILQLQALIEQLQARVAELYGVIRDDGVNVNISAFQAAGVLAVKKVA